MCGVLVYLVISYLLPSGLDAGNKDRFHAEEIRLDVTCRNSREIMLSNNENISRVLAMNECFSSLTVFTVYPRAPVSGILPSHENAGSYLLNLLLVPLDTGTMLGNKIPAEQKNLRTTKKTQDV